MGLDLMSVVYERQILHSLFSIRVSYFRNLPHYPTRNLFLVRLSLLKISFLSVYLQHLNPTYRVISPSPLPFSKSVDLRSPSHDSQTSLSLLLRQLLFLLSSIYASKICINVNKLGKENVGCIVDIRLGY